MTLLLNERVLIASIKNSLSTFSLSRLVISGAAQQPVKIRKFSHFRPIVALRLTESHKSLSELRWRRNAIAKAGHVLIYSNHFVSGEVARGDADGKGWAPSWTSQQLLHKCVPASANVTNLSSRILSCLTQSARLLVFQPRNMIMLIMEALSGESDCLSWCCCGSWDYTRRFSVRLSRKTIQQL